MDAALLTDSLPADVAGWWVSEKMDGCRAVWNGSKLLSRNGKDLKAPDSFTAGLPKGVRLDGELWMGRGTFDQLVSVIQKKGGDWAGVRFMVFDYVSPDPLEDRFSMANALESIWRGRSRCDEIPKCDHLHIVAHSRLKDHDDLSARESEIVRNGGEGCVIRRPGSPYRPGRMGDVIKVKRISPDVNRWQG